MKRIVISIINLSLAISTFSNDIKGSWSGVLDVGATKFTLILNISERGGVYSATMDSPNQGAKGIPISTITFENAKLTFSIVNIGVKYEGMLQDDSIIGTFSQAGMTFSLNLLRLMEESTSVKRPQTPELPYPYNTEDVRFENKAAGITLAGTLTLPKAGKNFPVAVLISGSGPQNRDEEVFGHKPFLVLSDYLTRNGIAVLRYDDRGVGESGGNYSTATLDDFAADAAAAVNYLKKRKEINSKKIGVIGHSEGGTVAFMVASEKNSDLAYIVSMAGVSIPGDSLMRLQRYLMFSKAGASDEQIAQNEALILQMQKVINKYSADSVFFYSDKYVSEALPTFLQGNSTAAQALIPELKKMASPEIQSLLQCNPSDALTKIKCPVLALNGEKDLQVPADANLDRVKALVKSHVTVKKYPGLNHLFQHCDTGLTNEYFSIEETISSEVLSDISEWIKQR